MLNVSAGPTVCVSRGPSLVTQRWPWTWKVWCSEPIAITSHCTSSPTLEWNTGVLPTNARPSIVWKSPIGAKTTSNSRSGSGAALGADREHPVHAAGDRVVHRRRVVVVGPHADGVVAGGQPVGPRPAGLDVAVAAGEPGHVGAVGARLVVHAVEVHRVRVVVERVHVLEVDAQPVAGLARGSADRGSGPGCWTRRARWAACASSAATSGGRRRSGTPSSPATAPCPVMRVALVGGHVPGGRRHGRDPDVAGGCRRSGGGGKRHRPQARQGGHERGPTSH